MRLAEQAQEFAEGARAANTRRAYASDWADFSAWCKAASTAALPADADTVANYLTAKAGELAVSTLARRLAAIRSHHLEHDHAPPASGQLSKVWSGIRRRRARPPKKKKALLVDLVRQVLAGLPETPTGSRDRALILIGFAGAFRRSELAAIELDGPGRTGLVWLEHVEEGVAIHLDRSKGDQDGRGVVVAIAMTGTELCPVAALDAWLKAARIRSGPVFRPVDRWGHVGPGAMTASAANDAVKRACRAVGLNPAVFTVHSLRRGCITGLHRAGVQTEEVRRVARHSRIDTTLGYIEEAGRFEQTAAGTLLR
jgi:integrase